MVRYNTKNTKTKKSKKLLLLGLIVVLLAVGFFFWLQKRTPDVKQVQISGGKTANANPNVPGSDDVPPSISITSSKDNDANQSASSLDPGIQPATPIGSFVSSHFMSFSGKYGPSVGTSTCTTTPGATCQIRFISGSVVKALPKHATNAQGSTSWDNWSLAGVGLTAGTWKITAVAANGSKTATANDSLQLVVKP